MPYQADILVVGCGNILFKDDGFGPAVIKAFHYYYAAAARKSLIREFVQEPINTC